MIPTVCGPLALVPETIGHDWTVLVPETIGTLPGSLVPFLKTIALVPFPFYPVIKSVKINYFRQLICQIVTPLPLALLFVSCANFMSLKFEVAIWVTIDVGRRSMLNDRNYRLNSNRGRTPLPTAATYLPTAGPPIQH